MVDFAYTETMADIAKLTRSIVDDQVTTARLAELDGRAPRFDETLWSTLEAAGVRTAMLPVEHGGDGLGRPEIAAVQIELGRCLAAVPFLEAVTAARALGGDEPDGITTVAIGTEVSAKGAALHGNAALVPYGDLAKTVLVAVGDALWLARTDDAGVLVQPEQLVDGYTAASVTFDGAQAQAVPDATAVQPADELTLGRCAHQLGVLERALELTAEYARHREQFGRPIGSFQAVTHRLADCYIDIEALRLTLWQAVLSGEPEDLATARYTAAEAGHRVAHAAVHVHGGAGLDTDNALHRYFLAAKRNEFALGSATEALVDLGSLLRG